MAPPILVTIMIITFVVVADSTALGFPIAMSDCEDHCGDVSIPYPFGIGQGCSHGEQFSLECDSSDSPLQPKFRGGLAISHISMEGQFQALSLVARDCYHKNGTRMTNNSPWIRLNRDSFIFNSTANKFTVIGCDTYAYIRGMSDGRNYTTGCMSICDKMEDVENGSCSGIGCCETSLPTGVSNISYSMGSYNNYTNFNLEDFSCSHAFVAENNAFKFYAANLTNLINVKSLPVVVNWVLETKTCQVAAPNACGRNSACADVEQTPGDLPSGYRCSCNPGYEGNPYLPQGCQDIDECKDRYPYPKNAICDNTLGNYTYHCIEGYHLDVAEERCIINKEQNIWPIIIGVGASVGGMSLLALFVCLYMELERRKKRSLKSEEFFRKNGGLILQQKLMSGEGSYNSRIFGHEELQNATNDFDDSRIIGRGGFGVVYRGELLDNKVVAIKKSRGVDEHQVEQFINEVMLLSQINSRNVVKLLGCCLETEAPLLVYEFISNGTLFEHLHNNVKAAKLSWNIRLRIASEVAGVLSYLHSVASPPIIHRDIKSDNILIDHNYTAKVSDFGISRLVASDDDDQVATMVQGTLGYLDPEYMQTGLLTEKSDVYSFGIVLIELLTGRKVLASNKPEAEKFLSNGFLSALKGDCLAQVLDTTISCEENMEQLKEVAEIAKRCIGVRGEDRPCMRDVERELEVMGKKGNKQVSVEVFEIDSSKTEAWLEIQSAESAGTSTGQYSVSFTTMDQPLLPISDGR